MNQSDFTINDKDKNSPASPLMKCFTTASLSECTNGRLSSEKDAKSSDASCKRGIGDSGDATFDGSPQRVSAGTVDGEATHSVFSKPSGFTTGRGAPISRTEESTEMAQQVMMECQEDRDPDACDGRVGNATYSENRTFSSGQCGNGKDDRLPKAPSAGSVAGNCADTFGFQTAGGRAISLSATAQQKARLLWESVRNETDCGEQADKIPPKVPPKEIVPGSTRLAEKPPLSSTVKPPGGTKPVNNVCENTKSNASKPKFDKSYKGFRPFKPPKLKQKTVATSRDQTGRVLNQSCGTKQTNNSARVAALEQILKQCDDIMDTNNDASGSRSAGESKEEFRPFTGLQQCSNPGPQASLLPSLSTGAEKSGETIAHQETSKSNFTLGFRKAGGADVTVSRQALRKAEMSHSEDGGDLSSRDAASMSVALNTSGEPQADATLKEPPMVGFMTASRKNVEVSDKAMSRAKSVWIEVQQAEREVSTARPMSGFVTAAGKEVKVSEEGMTRAKSLWTEDQNNAPESDEVLRDASGLSLPTCGSGLGHDSALTGFTKSGEVHSLQVSKAVLPSFTTAGGNDIQVSAEVMTHSESLWTDGQLGEPEISKGKQSMAGFITAAGKGVQVSAQALSRAETLWAEDKDMSGTTRGQTGEALKDGAVPGFMTAAGKSVGVSEKAFRHAKSLWSDGMQGEEEGSKGKPVSGFMTAAGKNVQASEDAMAHAKSWWNDGQSEMLQAASDRSSPVKGSEPEPKDTFSDVTEYSKHEAEAPNSKPMSGFTTAAGRQVRVSDDAMAQAKSLWTNDQRAQSGGECGEMLQGEANFSGPVSGLRSASSKGVFAGFTTAGGAAMKVSEKGLQHARSLWHEEGASFEHEGTAVGEQRTESLKQPTAHTNDGQVTQKKNEKLTGTSKKNDSKTSYTSPAVSPSGFQTAGGANVPVSDKSMKDAEKLWLAEQSDHDLADVEEAALSGQLCDLLDGSDADRTGMNRAAPNARAGEPAGFSTGKGRSVVLSKSALRAAQSLLSCEQEDVGPGSLLAVPPDDRLQDDRSDCSTDSTDRRIGKKLLAPQRPKNEEFHCDRRDFKRRRLQPVLTGESPEASERDPLASKLESGHVDAVKGKTTSTFKPPYKSTAHTLSSTSTLARPHPQSPRTSGSSSGFIAPRSRQSRPVDSSDTSTSSKSYIFFSKRGRGGGGGGRRGEITDAGQTNSATAAADTENSASERNSEIPNCSVAPSVVDESLFDMNDEEENRLLCREMDNLSEVMEQPAESNPAVALSCGPPSSPKLENAKLQSDDSKKSEEREGRAKSVVHQPSSVRGSNNATNEEATAGCATISAGVKTQSARAMLPADVLDEARMRQDKLCRVKLRKKIQPRKGRWLEERSKNGGSRSYQESGLAPLWDLSRKELLHLGVSESTLGVSSCSAALFRLDLRRHYPGLGGSVLLGDGALLVPDAHGFAGWEEFHSALLTLDSVDPKLMDKSWTENHYRWIVWKLAASEVSFPHHLAGRSLSPENVMYQLKYRYDREVDLCQRSALRKILERDDAAGKRMVLCVSSVKKESNGQLSVEVTDGWYCLRAQVDGVLNDLLTRGRLQAGDKIVTSGAEIVGAQDACSPLEVKEGTALKLSGNSTRPAPWCAKLGFCSTPAALCVPLSSLSPHGDTVGCVDVVLTRKYPVMYMEKLGDGSHVFRSEEEEGRALRAFEERRQEQAEKVMAKLQAEMDAEDAADRVRGRRHRRVTRKEVEDLWSGQDIAEAVERALNPEEVQQSLSASQLSRLEEYTRSQMERKQQEMNRKLQDAMAEKAVDTRHVTPVQKFRVAGCCSRDIDAKARCLVTVWRPGAEWSEMCEGGRYRLFHLAASASRGANKQCRVSLTASRQTRVQPRPISENLCDLIYEPREAWLVKDLERTQPMGGEFDFVGALVRLVQPARPSHPFVLYLCDSEKDFLCVKIWHPTQHQVNAWKEKPCLVVCNLTLTNQTYRGSGSTLVTAEARSEFTTFTSSGHTSQYRGTFSEMTNMRKSRNFFQDANDRLDQRLSSSAPSTRSSSTQEEHHQQDCSEDFPPDVLEKVFGPMSQGDGFPTAGASAAGTERRQTRDLDANSDLTRGRLAGVKRGHSNDNVSQISTKRKSSSSTPDLSANNLEGKSPSTSAVCEEDDQSGESEVLKKRKRLLREKMRKLMAYDKPSPLSTLPNGGSPASGKEFKSPFPKKS
ncbi:uncharacterized protein LOC101847983 [Aplysia californica]|uniref:Uncharacterized protein LOC101847983 n=1 Tax=Aplysia californica TaxID=6500 RepID=A0ABM1A651_APLCA|nr:uncharacterized protein LOC101847983 [Aplysia californica]